MTDINALLIAAKTRNALSELDDDTGVEEHLAALYLCLSPKEMGELRAIGGGPVYVQPPRVLVGCGHPVSYVMRELRAWRLARSAGSDSEIARRYGVAGWATGLEPFWLDSAGLIIAPAMDHDPEDETGKFLKTVSGKARVDWMTKLDALGRRWNSVEAHSELVDQYLAVQNGERAAVLGALEATGATA